MFEEVAIESIAEARNAYTYEEIDGCYQEAKEIADKARGMLWEKWKVHKNKTPTEAGV